MPEQSIPIEVVPASDRGYNGTLDVTVRIRISDDLPPPQAMTLLNSPDTRRYLIGEWGPKNAPGCGMAQHGGLRPWFKVDDDRTSGLIGYMVDYRFTPSL